MIGRSSAGNTDLHSGHFQYSIFHVSGFRPPKSLEWNAPGSQVNLSGSEISASTRLHLQEGQFLQDVGFCIYLKVNPMLDKFCRYQI
jgi:hypothetical protein